MSKRANSVMYKSTSKDIAKTNQKANINTTTTNNNNNGNERKSVLEEKNQNEDINMDNLSFCSDDTVELIAESNDYFFEDENMVENERILLTEPKYHKTFRVLHTRINLSRISTNEANTITTGTEKNNLNDPENSKNDKGS
jgi:hypothetical protein